MKLRHTYEIVFLLFYTSNVIVFDSKRVCLMLQITIALVVTFQAKRSICYFLTDSRQNKNIRWGLGSWKQSKVMQKCQKVIFIFLSEKETKYLQKNLPRTDFDISFHIFKITSLWDNTISPAFRRILLGFLYEFLTMHALIVSLILRPLV